MEDIIYEEEVVTEKIFDGQIAQDGQDLNQAIFEELKRRGINYPKEELDIRVDSVHDEESESLICDYEVFRTYKKHVPYKVTRQEVYSGEWPLDRRMSPEEQRRIIFDEMRRYGIEIGNEDELEIEFDSAHDEESEAQICDYVVTRVTKEKIEGLSQEEMMQQIYDELVSLREKVMLSSDSSEISALSARMSEVSDQLDRLLESTDRDYSPFETVLADVERQIEDIQAAIDANSRAYLESYERIKLLVEEQTAAIKDSMTQEELDRKIEELMQEKMAENVESLSIRQELEKQAEELRKLVRKRNRVRKDLETAKQLGLSAAEYKEITDNFRSRKLAHAIIRKLGLGDILDIPYKDRTPEQRRRINAIRKEIIEQLAAEKREHADKSILNIVEALYGIETEVRLQGKQRILVIKPKALEAIKQNAQKLPEKIKTNDNVEVTYTPGEAPDDMKEVMESSEASRGLTDKFTFFRDARYPGKTFARENVFQRFYKEPVGDKVFVDGALCYEMAQSDVDDIVSKQNNSFSPFVVDFVDTEIEQMTTALAVVDNKDMPTALAVVDNKDMPTALAVVDEATSVPRGRNSGETDEEYLEYLKDYYDKKYGSVEATVDIAKTDTPEEVTASEGLDSTKTTISSIVQERSNKVKTFSDQMDEAFEMRKNASKHTEEELRHAEEIIARADRVTRPFDENLDDSEKLIDDLDYAANVRRNPDDYFPEEVEWANEYIERVGQVDDALDHMDEMEYERLLDHYEDALNPTSSEGLDSTATDSVTREDISSAIDESLGREDTVTEDVQPVEEEPITREDISSAIDESLGREDAVTEDVQSVEPITKEDISDALDEALNNAEQEEIVPPVVEEETDEERRGLIEGIIIYRDTESNRYYAYDPVFDRFNCEELGEPVRLEGILGYEIDSMDVERIVANQNNDYSPYQVEFRETTIDKTMDTNPPVVDTAPPVVDTAPPVVDTDPPVVETTPPKEEVEVITLFRDLNDNNQVYAPDEVLDKFGIKTLAAPTMIQGKPCHKISRDTDQIINSIAKMNKNPRQEVKYIDVRVKEITKEVPRPHVEEILDKLTRGLDIRARDCDHYRASNLRIARGFREELKSGNYAYNIVHVIPAILKAGISVFRKLAGILMTTDRAQKAMKTIEERLASLSDIELEVLFEEYKGSQLKTDMNNQINPLILDRLRQFGLAKVSKLNDQIRVDYTTLFTLLGQIKALEERMKKSGKDKGSLENQRQVLMSQAAVHVRAIIENRKLADNLLSSGVHGLEEDFKAVSTRLSYVGMRFAKTNDFDNDLQHQLGMLGRRLNVALAEEDDEAIVQNFMGLETCYYENTEIRGSLAGKRSVGSKYYSPMAEQFDYRDDPFIRDLFTTVAVTSAAISAINAIRVHQIEVADRQAEIDAVNAQNDATMAQVRQTGQEIAGKRETFQQGMEAQAQQDILTSANTRERAHLDLTNWTFNDAYRAADDAGHAAYNQFNIDVTNQINAVTSDYAQGLITQADALQRMAEISNNAQTTLHEVVDSSLTILRPYAATHPQFDLTAVEQSMEYMLAHPTAIADMNQAMVDVTNLADGLSGLEAAHISSFTALPSDMATTLICAASAAALAANVSNSMQRAPKKGTYGNEVTDMMEDYVAQNKEAEAEEERVNTR